MIEINSISKAYGKELLFHDWHENLNRGDRVGIVGPNGAGKSTALNIVAGLEKPDIGSVTSSGARIGHLVQMPDPAMSVKQYVDEAIGGLLSLGDELQDLFLELAEDNSEASINEVALLQTKFEQRDGWSVGARIEEVFSRLDIPQDAMSRTFGELSGGQQARVMLAAQLIDGPDVLLLDEPTNNLDTEGLEWLEGYLSGYPGAVLVVSHDREFLDRTVTRIVEIDGSGDVPGVYHGGYSSYREQAANEELRRQQDIEAQRKREQRTAQTLSIMRARAAEMQGVSTSSFYRNKAAKVARRTNALAHRLMRDQAAPTWVHEKHAKPAMPLELTATSIIGRHMLKASKLSLAYEGGPTILEDVDIDVYGQDRIAFTGNNGAGKSTLLRALYDDESNVVAGKIQRNADIAYISQTREHESIRRVKDQSMLEWFRANVGSIYEDDAIGLLIWFGFEKHLIHQSVSTLSPGEISKLLLLTAAHSGREVLVLDEPTNHLDIDALDVVEHALTEFKGTLLVASHDRRFLGNIACNRVLRVESGSVSERRI